MLIVPNTHLYAYIIRRDFGFAPNPFHGTCTLATCKPDIRHTAKVGDWILGVGGSLLGEARGKCILLMKVSEKISFQEYWEDNRFQRKKPVYNGSNIQMLGDNIYHKDENGDWIQEESHHSEPNGTTNIKNLKTDTGKSDQVLISDCFLYFGNQAQVVDLDSIKYKGGIGYKKINLSESAPACELITSMFKKNKNYKNMIIAEPCQFIEAHKRVDQSTGKIF